jgi:hypothetical protein
MGGRYYDAFTLGELIVHDLRLTVAEKRDSRSRPAAGGIVLDYRALNQRDAPPQRSPAQGASAMSRLRSPPSSRRSGPATPGASRAAARDFGIIARSLPSDVPPIRKLR